MDLIYVYIGKLTKLITHEMAYLSAGVKNTEKKAE